MELYYGIKGFIYKLGITGRSCIIYISLLCPGYKASDDFDRFPGSWWLKVLDS